MGSNQSNSTNNTKDIQSAESTTASSYRRNRLTYQESFDIRTRKQSSTKRYQFKDDKSSLSSNSESDIISGYSYSSKKKIKRKRSNIRPPLVLYTNQNRFMDLKQKREMFTKKMSVGSASANSENVVIPNAAENVSSFDNTDIEEEIDLILNEHRGNQKPWYKDPRVSTSSSTVSPIKSEKKYSSAEDLCSSKSLPTPSFYLYLTFDEDMKKSKSIEVLDDPCYFFLNYDEDTKVPSESNFRSINNDNGISDKSQE